ncbi:helix-turn-helix domain-containing protein [Leisingera sp. ANG-M7]|uniref:helix-turn-helix domain-containing protein n=1 Tax=Leisingera sp. ANG-M7 TaxID=1577902 RepID=UPI001F4CA984|nr:LysR family transcriptional regulator [Leisingera sp. ANG-M7]
MIEIGAILVFVAVAEAGGFAAAARQLGITKSAVSKRIGNLEAHLGCSCFIARHAACLRPRPVRSTCPMRCRRSGRRKKRRMLSLPCGAARRPALGQRADVLRVAACSAFDQGSSGALP